ncbi:Nuclear pore complex protein [Thalictrum thalictroides]|uniref:Nuclear pore complex protein n=1 Tax=Thalictrum thalictroides TaxID=46969 RepID=A0A7J6VSE7_THATH|nr:Nuclear pore complex protein [Thalictrum thalictroides]
MATAKEEEENATTTAVTIELDLEEEGNWKTSDDLLFQKIGASLPLKPQSSSFDLENPPTQALAVSEKHEALFLAHPEGFYVAKTRDVIEAAKLLKEKGKGYSIEELSVVDVQIGRTSILALSKDSSTLVASVAAHLHFFSVTSLLNKEKESSYSCSVDESSSVKDFRWRKKKKTSFLVLSSNGTLYQGDLISPLKEAMDSVDAVDWSPEGNFIAVAKKNCLNICSSRLKERLTFSMPFSSFTSDHDTECIIKVDSINWVRQDCIVLGCFQITEDGKEDGYIIQVISTKEGKISEASSKPVVMSFDGAFADIYNDIVPSGCGPHLFLNYLEHRELALLANKKNTDRHIILFGWSLDDNQNEAAFVELGQEDKWHPKIGLQENEDDNLIMGFGVDKVSLYEKVEVTVGVERKELSPFCILLCLTLDGKLMIFYVLSLTENPDSPKIVFAPSDEEEDTSSRVEEERVEGTICYVKSPEMSQEELEILKDKEQITELNDNSKTSSHVDNLSYKKKSSRFSMSFESAGENRDLLQPSSAAGKQNSIPDPPSLFLGNQSLNSEISSENSPLFLGSDSVFKDSRKLESQKAVTSSLKGNISSILHPIYKDSLGSDEVSNDFSRNLRRDAVQSASCGSHSNRKHSSSDEDNTRLSSAEVKRDEHSGFKVGSKVHVTGTRTSSDLPYGNSNAGSQFAINTTGRSIPIGEQRDSPVAGKFESESAVRGSQISYEGPTSHNSLESKLQLTHKNLINSQFSYEMASEREFSKHFSIVNEMAKELDALLSCIEGEGGFRDVCIIFQESSVTKVEQGLENLTERCKVWKSKMVERFEGMPHLLDQTMQVLARKVFIEGIVKQASNNQYWDIWDRQKLTPEFELKRKQILKVNQDLTNQLIELERHFNTMELNRFGETGGYSTNRRVFHGGLKPSRDGHAFNRLYNTMNSQLAVAEQLSDCLTKQMAVLNVESPSAKRKFVAKELFESIGLAYDGDSFKSPNVKMAVQSQDSVKKLPYPSYSAAIKDQSRRNPISVMKTSEPETARRRVSLDPSWASFEPPKTTVKRMLLHEERPRVNANKLSLVTNEKGLQQSSVAHLRDNIKSSPSLNSYANNQTHHGIQAKSPSAASPSLSFNWTNDLPAKSESTSTKSPIMQGTQRSNLMFSSSVMDSTPSPWKIQDNTNKTLGLVSDRSSSGRTPVKTSDSIVNRSLPTSSFGPAPTQILISRKKTPHEMSMSGLMNSKHGDTDQTKATSGFVNYEVNHAKPVSVPLKSHNPPFTLSASPTVGVQNRSSQLETVTKESVPGLLINPPSVSVSDSLSDLSQFPPIKSPILSSISPSSTSSLSLGQSEATTKPLTDGKPPIGSSSSSNSSTSTVSPNSFSLQTANQEVHTSTSSTIINVKSEFQFRDPKPMTPPFEPKPKMGESNSKLDVNASPASPSLPESKNGQFSLKSEMFVAAAPAADVLNTSGSIDAKYGSSDLAGNQGDEMEEEASDTTTDLNLGSFGGFGIGSVPTSAIIPKSNPFGVAFQNTVASPVSSPFNMTVPSGELFRPASFSLQPVQPSQPANQSAFSNRFSSPEPTRSAFGQPAQIGAGQQALGSVLGTFGQSRQLGTSPPGTGFASTSAFGSGGFAASSASGGFGFSSGFGTPPSGFANASTGGFAGVASTVGGFSGVASGGGGFAAAASGGGGFAGVGSAAGAGFVSVGSAAGGGFAGVGSAAGGGFAAVGSAGGGGFAGVGSGGGAGAGTGGFGAFNNQAGSGGFSTFGSSSAGSAKPPSELFTQMRR